MPDYLMRTNIPELDQLLRNGFHVPRMPSGKPPKGLLILIRGGAGSGKSTLAMQIANCAQWIEKPGDENTELTAANDCLFRHFASLEQDEEQLQWRRSTMIRAAEPEPRVELACRYVPTFRDSGSGVVSPLISPTPYADIARALAEIENEWLVARSLTLPKKAALIVLDGLSVMTHFQRQEVRFAVIAQQLQKIPGISVIIYEPGRGEEAMLDHRADVVIELQETQLSEPIPYAIHQIHIRKSRYQEAVLGRHQYKFGKQGLQIIPSLHFQVHHRRPSEAVPRIAKLGEIASPETPITKSQTSILENVVGQLDGGHSLAVFGPRGSFKTELSIDFLSVTETLKPIDKEKKSLLVSLLGGGPELKLQCPHAAEKGNPCTNAARCRLCSGRLMTIHQPPGCITPAEFLYNLRNWLTAEKQITRFAFWDLTQLDHRFPLLNHDPMFLPAVLEMLGGRHEDGPAIALPHTVKSLFMGAGNAGYTDAFSAIADNVVFCWRWTANLNELTEKLPKTPTPFENTPDISEYVLQPRPAQLEFVLVYVDRTAGDHAKPSKQLYGIPVEGTSLSVTERDKSVFHIDISCWQKLKEVKERIDRIIHMQDVQ
jgi:hypothetical protein